MVGAVWQVEHPIMLSGVEASTREMLPTWSLLSRLSLSSLDIVGYKNVTHKSGGGRRTLVRAE